MNWRSLFPWAIRRYLKKIAGVPDMWNSLYQLKRNNFNPKIIFDVGAFSGEWTKNACKIFPSSNYFLFEPQEAMTEILSAIESNNIVYENIFLGDMDGLEVNFYEQGTSSSALRYGPHIPIKKVTTSLDSYCIKNSIKNIDILKMDVQGYELNILKGAQSILKDVELIIAEVSFIDVIIDCPLANEVIQFLDSCEFQLIDVVDFKPRALDNLLWQVDMFFLKKDSFLLKDKRKDIKQLRPNG